MTQNIKIDQSSKKKQKMLFLLIAPVCVGLIVYMGIHEAMFGSENPKGGKIETSSVDRMIVSGDTTQVSIDDKLKLYELQKQKEAQNEQIAEKKQTGLDDIFGNNNAPVDTAAVIAKPVETVEAPVAKKRITYASSNTATPKTVKRTVTTNKKVDTEEKRGFYSSSSSKTNQVEPDNEFLYKEYYTAFADRDEILRSGQTLHMRFAEDAYINGVTVKKGTMFTGVLTFSGERANIKVTNIKLPDMILPTKIIVFDIEGNEGLYSPGGFNQEASQDVVNSGTDVKVNIPIIGSISKKVGQKKLQDRTCKVAKNHKILIKDFSQN